MPSTPHITVASVIEQDGKYLMVKEVANDLIVFNQPAGHLGATHEHQQAVAASQAPPRDGHRGKFRISRGAGSRPGRRRGVDP